MSHVIDRCGFRFIVLLIWWVVFSELSVPTGAKVIATFSSAICLVGAIERKLFKSAPETKREKKRISTQLKSLFTSAINKANARRFIVTALILLGFGFFIRSVFV